MKHTFLFAISAVLLVLTACKKDKTKDLPENDLDLKVTIYAKTKLSDSLQLFYRLENEEWNAENQQTLFLKNDSVSSTPVTFNVPGLEYLLRLDFGNKKEQEITIDSIQFKYKNREITISTKRVSSYVETTGTSRLISDNPTKYGVVVVDDAIDPILLFQEEQLKQVMTALKNGTPYDDGPFVSKELEYPIKESPTIIANVEEVSQEGNSTIIRGWALKNDQECIPNYNFIILTNEKDDTLVYTTQSYTRKDVTEYINNGQNYDNSGFVFNYDNLNKNNYKVYIGVLGQTSDTVYFAKSDKTINVK